MKKRVLPSLLAIAIAATLLVFSVMLMMQHVRTLQEARAETLPLAASLPPLERRLQLLKDQVELTQLHAALRTGSPEEKLHAYVLPETDDIARLLAFVDVARGLLEKKELLRSMSAVDVGVREPVSADRLAVPETDGPSRPLMTQRLAFDAVVKPEGMQILLNLVDLSGLLTVGDALGDEQVQMLFNLTEAQNPAGIVAVEKFLSADLFAYVRDPRLADKHLTQSFPSEQFLRQFHALLAESQLKDAKDLLGGEWGRALEAQQLWPSQFLTPETVIVEKLSDGWVRVSLALTAWSRPR